MSTKTGFRSFTQRLSSWVVRWLEILGQNPSPVREPGFYAWPYFHQQRYMRPPTVRSTSWFGLGGSTDDPHTGLHVRS